MMQKIKPEAFETELFNIKGTKTDKLSVMFVDFQYSNSNPSTFSSTPMSTSQSSYPNTISPNIFTKYVTLDSMAITLPIQPFKATIYWVRDELNKKFIEMISDLGEKNKESAPEKNFDINIPEMRKKQMNPARGIIAKINNISNFIATEGRIGPAQYIISNRDTYSYILKNLGNVNFMFKVSPSGDNELWIGNIKYIIDDSVENDIILVGRKNSVDQPGIHCLILTDDNGDIIFDEFESYANKNNKTYIMHYKIVDLGFHPQYQYFKINTRDITYYRNLKLKKIKELYGN